MNMRVHALAAALALLSPVAFAQHAGHPLPEPEGAGQAQAEFLEGPGANASTGTRRESVHGGSSAPSMARTVPPDAPTPGPADDMATGGEEQTQIKAPADPHAGHPKSQETSVDHSAPARETPVDHSQMHHPTPAQDVPVDHSRMDHSQKDHARMQHGVPAQPRTPIPPVTDADRAAASFIGGHAAHDDGIYTFVQFDRLEATDGDHGRGQAWEMQAWMGKDIDRLWLRSEGERVEGRTESADLELLYGRAISPWWDLVAGLRHDFKPGQARSHAAIGVVGMAPYKFEVEATAYLSGSGDLSARLEAEYDTLLTNRLILQWQAEAELYGADDPARRIGSGLSSIEAGLRLRYEIRREFAPYVGIVRERAFGGTADLRLEHGDPVDDTRVVAGVRIWF
jgi:copper resistance protein B